MIPSVTDGCYVYHRCGVASICCGGPPLDVCRWRLDVYSALYLPSNDGFFRLVGFAVVSAGLRSGFYTANAGSSAPGKVSSPGFTLSCFQKHCSLHKAKAFFNEQFTTICFSDVEINCVE